MTLKRLIKLYIKRSKKEERFFESRENVQEKPQVAVEGKIKGELVPSSSTIEVPAETKEMTDRATVMAESFKLCTGPGQLGELAKEYAKETKTFSPKLRSWLNQEFTTQQQRLQGDQGKAVDMVDVNNE